MYGLPINECPYFEQELNKAAGLLDCLEFCYTILSKAPNGTWFCILDVTQNKMVDFCLLLTMFICSKSLKLNKNIMYQI